MTPYSLHVRRWSKGCGSEQCSRANRVVLARGQLPCDVLFCGEAPGASEDVLGQPFVGPAGKLLDQIISDSLPEGTRYALTNVVACIPRDDAGGKSGEPDEDQLQSCKPRLEEFIKLASPRLIVCVGKVSRDWLAPGYKHSAAVPEGVKMVGIVHPAAILRSNPAWRQLEVQKAVVVIRNAVSDL